jgi:predicted lipoprotein with Yx(FWY)xxD motif
MRSRMTMLVALGLAMSASPGAAQDASDGGARLQVAESPRYGAYLTDANGYSLYLFTADEQGRDGRAAASACYEDCAQAWPPVLATGALPAVSGEEIDHALLGITERQDGLKQVTYNGWPLYTFVKDQEPGQVAGQDVKSFGGEWYLITPAGRKAKEG